MSGNLDWQKLEGLEEPTPAAPTHTRSFAEKILPKEKEQWESLEGLPAEEKGVTYGEMVREQISENFKAPLRFMGRQLITAFAGPSKGIGSALEAFSEIGEKGEKGDLIKGKGTGLIKEFGSYLSSLGKRNEAFLKKDLEKYLGKSYSTTEETLTKAGERATNIFSQLPVAGMLIPAVAGGILGQTGEAMGLDEDAQSMLEMTGMMSKDVGKVVLKAMEEAPSFGEKLLNIIKRDPKATGKLTGLAGVQLEAFKALSEAEQGAYLKNLAEKEVQLRSGITAEEVAAEALEGQQQGTGRSLAGRVTEGGEDIGVRPGSAGIRPTTTTEENLENVLNRVNVNEIGNKRQAGIALKNTVMESDNAAYQHVNDLYTRARELNEGINAPHAQLAHQLQNRLRNLQRIPRPSSVQRNLMNALEDIIGELAVVEGGAIVSYPNVNNQVLIDQIQSLRQTVDFDFEHGSPKGIFRPTINEIQESVYRAGEGAAAESLGEANTAYREWTQNYNNDTVNPYRDRSNQNYEKLLGKNLESDHFNVINNLVGETPQGNDILRASQREIVEKKLKKFVDNPALVRSRDFRRAMTDLESVLSPEQLNTVRSEMEAQVPPRLIRKVTGPKGTPTRAKAAKGIEEFTKDTKAAAKYSNKTPEKIRKLSKTPEGVAELKQDLSRTKNGKDIFNKLAQEKMESIIRGGKIRGKLLGKDVYDIINNKENYALIEAFTSQEEAKEMLDLAEKVGKKKFTVENIKKVGKSLGKFKLLHFLFT